MNPRRPAPGFSSSSPSSLHAGTQAATHCTTCADELVRVRVLDITGTAARCEDDCGRRHAVDTTFVGGAVRGETLLVHAGVALARACHAGDEAP